MDADLASSRQVLPEMHVLDCRKDDCRKQAEQGGCLYYFRSVGCYYFDREPLPVACAAHGVTPEGERLPCLVPECARVERWLRLSPVDERTVYPHGVWGKGDVATHFPYEAGVGLYRVVGVQSGVADRTTVSER